MDILAARKKAAELAKTGKTPQEQSPAASPDSEAVIPAGNSSAGASAAQPSSAGQGTGQVLAPPPQEPVEVPAPAAVAEGIEENEEQQPEGTEAREEELEMLAFLLGSEEYIVPVELVGEVLTPREITPVPHAPSYVLGVCSLRGMVLPIIDLKRRLGLPDAARDEKSRIIVVALGPDDRVGLYVDRVRGVVKIPPSSVRPAPDTMDQGEGAAFLQGIARRDDRLFILLDVARAAGDEQQ